MLEAFPVELDGQRAIGLRDPAGFTDQVAVFPIPLLDLVSLFDGEHSVDEIRAILLRRHGQGPSLEDIQALAARLDAAGFLESAGFARRRRAIETGFKRSRVRPPAHAGSAYAREADTLAAQIEGFFSAPNGPGSFETPPGASDSPPLRGLIAPHIDFHRGGPTYAWAYRELLERSDADCFVILGTCHAGMRDPFAVTLKPFDTPLGQVPVDRDFCLALERRARQDLRASEGAHRHEHSIEFQAVLLHWCLGRRRPFTIVPVLASWLHEAVVTRGDPEADRRVPRFLDALGETIEASSRRICVIAGVDLAHVGPRFGDPEPNTPESLARLEELDRGTLERVTRGDARGFYGRVAFDGDSRRICGLSPIYAFVRALGGTEGRLLRYGQWPDPEGTVTFCAAAFP
jgi:AmmeMemoRadiSam system protein B